MKVEITYPNGEWVKFDDVELVWEYQEGEDPETYVSGSFTLSKLPIFSDKLVVTDYDGAFTLPLAVIHTFSPFFFVSLL